MSHADFVHLHLHSEYSLLDGACRLDKLVERAKALKFSALAITDHGVLFGAIDFYRAARDAGIKPIIGCEVYIAPNSRFDRKAPGGRGGEYNHLVLLAKDEQGYRNLCKLVTAAHLEGFYYKPRIDKEILARHKDGLIALSACLAGEIPEAILNNDLKKGKAAIEWYVQTFGAENFYLELQNHGIADQAKVNKQLVAWAGEMGVKLVATNDVHYLEKNHSHAHDVLICIGTQTTLNDPKRMTYQPEQFYLRSAEEMKALFPENPDAISNTLEVAEKCNVEIEFGKLFYPVFDPPGEQSREGYLRQLLAEGLHKRYTLRARVDDKLFIPESVEDPSLLPGCQGMARQEGDMLQIPEVAAAVKAVIDRLQIEMVVIEKTGFISYFLIVGDFVRHGRQMGVSCVARGSAAGSIVTYLLEISNVDPIRYNLLFERFLNPERVNPPDIDIDFADDRRADVIEYVRQKYGRECVAQIITFGTMGAKSVIRDVGRAMALGYSDCDRLAKMIPNELKMNLNKALTESADFKNAYDTEPVTNELVNTALVLEDLTRNSSVHAAGVVIGPEPLSNLLPLKQDEDGTIVTQYAMGPVGDLGLLKMDFLGLKTLTVIRNVCEMVKAGKGIDIPIDRLPLDDAKTYDLLNKGNTVGVFQLESGGMRDLCRRFQIGSVEHITALVSLYRPGPMDLIPNFIDRRHGRAAVEYPHPLLEKISKETYGVLIYQEQVMQAAQLLAGYTLGGADLLRRAMGKKKVEEMQKHRGLFVKGAAKVCEMPEGKANEIFDLLEKFAGYGFNKSHAAAYAIVAYQTAYLKSNYPVEFLAAMMTNEMGTTEKLSVVLTEAREMDVEVLPPDVNEGQALFAPTPDGKKIRFGLAAIKGVGGVAVDSIIKARNEGGKFSTLQDMCERVDTRTVNRKVLESLIKSGACDCFGETRATLYAAIDRTLSRAASTVADRARGQSSLFGMFEQVAPAGGAVDDLPRVPEWPQNQLLAAEKELLGLYITGHPLTPYANLLQRYGLSNSVSARQVPPRTLTRIGGLVSSVQQGISKKTSKPYMMVGLEDLEGTMTMLVLAENCDKYKDLLVPNKAVLIVGEVSNDEDKAKIFPQEMMALEDAPKKYTKQVHLRFQSANLTTEKLQEVHRLVCAHPGRCPLFLCFMQPNGEVIFVEANSHFNVTPSRDLQKAVDALMGEGTYYPKVDTNLPEREKKRWEKKSDSNGGGGGDE